MTGLHSEGTHTARVPADDVILPAGLIEEQVFRRVQSLNSG